MKREWVLLIPVIAPLSGCVSSVPTVTSANSAPAMVTQNPAGTMTLKKGTSGKNIASSGAKTGLVIPAQVIAPTAERKHDGTSPSESR